MLPYFFLGFFPFLVVYAAFSDLLSMTIANKVSLALVAGFFFAGHLIGMPPVTIVLHVAVGGAVLLATFAMFAAGWMGGGDAKFLAATAIWFGPTPLLLEYLLVSTVFGGLLTIGLLMARSYMVPATGIDFIDRLLDDRTGIPYGIALGAGGLTVYAHSGWMDVAVKGLAAPPF